ncbi:ATP synthase F0F1 subunit epsilon [Frondihabitans sp. PAMC 28766]|uniref:F0F1 ATP synthase subunit epsilon n=1 Tax=Frondihabitans sp. PAMC 28766 TaxID=1795630 RepID=UPI00078DA3FE|nr:F0F1 ATP synthase subunit epsilon [Frondihabitans sp. PAMC 28766]AMM21150.1 ATP synthase F0F1 subunit epsilon [Frondihabitans sp. PAMC 28766]
MPLNVNVVSADQQVWSGEAAQVTARTTEGEIGILPGHEPVLAILATGQVRVRLSDGATVEANAEDGFLSVENDTVTIVSRNASLVS